MPPQHPVWLDYATAVGPLLAVIVAVGVAIMQYYLQRQQQRQDLFAKRFAVYEVTKDYLLKVLDSGVDVSSHEYEAFDRAIDPAEWLFGPDVKDYLRELRRLSVKWNETEQAYEHWQYEAGVLFPEDPAYANATAQSERLYEEAASMKRRLIEEYHTGLKMRLSEYLNVSDSRPWCERLEETMTQQMERSERRLATRYQDRR
jgi:hypothetical protein